MNYYVNIEDVFKAVDIVMIDENIKHKGKAIRKRLKELPTEDVVEVKHGHWNEDGRCSNCDWYMPFDCEGNAVETHFCPHCGAKMDKKEGAEE